MVAHPSFDQTGISGTILNRQIEQRNVKQWTRLSFSSVYYVLNQLVKKGFIETRNSNQAENTSLSVGAPQKLFLVTEKGKKVRPCGIRQVAGKSLCSGQRRIGGKQRRFGNSRRTHQ